MQTPHLADDPTVAFVSGVLLGLIATTCDAAYTLSGHGVGAEVPSNAPDRGQVLPMDHGKTGTTLCRRLLSLCPDIHGPERRTHDFWCIHETGKVYQGTPNIA